MFRAESGARARTTSGSLVNTAATAGEGVDPHDWFSPAYTRTRQVEVCTSFVDADAREVYLDSVFAALGA